MSIFKERKQKENRVFRRMMLTAAICIIFLMSGAAAAEAKTASEITKADFIKAVAAVARYARVNNYTYGDSRTEIPTQDKKISCDRLIARALWDLGFRDQPVGGITVGSMISYLRAHGFTESTNPADIGYGSIVIVKVGSVSYWSHTFVTESYDPSTRISVKYDCGTQSRINAAQPFRNEPWYYQNTVLIFNIPEALHVTSVSFDTNDAVMLPGQSFQINASVQPETATNRTVKWTSSDPNVASVSDTGVVKTLAPGKAVIEAVSADSGVKASCSVEVLEVPVTKVKLNRRTKTISKNSSFRLRATVAPADATNRTVVFTSSKPRVASVTQDGTVIGLRSGTAKITARAGKKQAVCSVTVKYVPVQSVSMRKTLTLKVGKSFWPKVKIRPLNASDTTLIWKSSNKRVAKVSEKGGITALRKGRAVITVITKSGRRKAKCVVTVK